MTLGTISFRIILIQYKLPKRHPVAPGGQNGQKNPGRKFFRFRPDFLFAGNMQKKARIFTIRALKAWWEVVDSNHRSR